MLLIAEAQLFPSAQGCCVEMPTEKQVGVFGIQLGLVKNDFSGREKCPSLLATEGSCLPWPKK